MTLTRSAVVTEAALIALREIAVRDWRYVPTPTGGKFIVHLESEAYDRILSELRTNGFDSISSTILHLYRAGGLRGCL